VQKLGTVQGRQESAWCPCFLVRHEQGTLKVHDPFLAPLDRGSFGEDLGALDKVVQEQDALTFPCSVDCWNAPWGFVLEGVVVAEEGTHGGGVGFQTVVVGLQGTDFVPIDQVCCNHLVGCSSQIVPHVSLRARTFFNFNHS